MASAPRSNASTVCRAASANDHGTITRMPPSATVSSVSVWTVCASPSVAGMPSAWRQPRSISASSELKTRVTVTSSPCGGSSSACEPDAARARSGSGNDDAGFMTPF
jgi:hypothetical protein